VVKVAKNNELISRLLSMTEPELAKFLSELKPDTLEYVEIILDKAEKRTLPQLKNYLDTK
jgi:hypothetical protein